MEFFEKAHVSKRSPPKKDSKSEENVKKHLKQMLHGYKQSDNDLIRNSGNAYNDIAEAHRVLDDSTSVSGFSDLDLTKSDDEDTVAVLPSEFTDDNVSNNSNVPSLDSSEQSDENSQDTTDKIAQELIEHVGDYLEPISEGDEDIESLPDDTISSEYSSSSGDISLLEFEGTSHSTSESDLDDFDADGLLASRIMEKLGKNKISPVSKKRKLDNTTNLNLRKGNKKGLINKETKSSDIEIEGLSLNDNEDLQLLDGNTQDSTSTNASAPFISITATEMNDQNLNEILGEYKHPTIRNLPSEKQNTSANNSGVFSTDDNMQVEDIDSLIPEVGDDSVLQDIDAEITADKEETNEEIIDTNADIDIDTHAVDYKHRIKTYNVNNSYIFVLQHPSELYINGKVKVKPLGGSIEVFGNILKKEVDLYSPNNSIAHCLKTLEFESVYYGLFSRLTTLGLAVNEAEEIVTTLGEYDCVISLTPLHDAKLDFVDRHFASDLFARLKVDSNAGRLTAPSNILNCNIYFSRPFRFFEKSDLWDEAVGCGMKSRSRGIVCGGKGVGKSTFVRYYINSMLDRGPVLVIDLDPGQAEFTVAGCVSATVVSTPLLGPNYTHLKTPQISYNIGMINTMDNTFRYASAIAKLIEQCHTKYASMPWIINTMGMTNHMGLKYILLTIIHVKPTFLIQIDSKIKKKRFEYTLEPRNVKMLCENSKYDRIFQRLSFPRDLDYKFILARHLEASFRQDTSLSPRDERYLNFLAYFGELMYRNKDFLGIIPYEVKLSELNIVTNVKVSLEAILQVINGKIVALCQLATTDKGKVFTLQDNAPLCHGHGLVRGVDVNNKLVYLLTPVPAERLAHVNGLVYSDWAPEIQATERQLPTGIHVPYRGATQHKQHMIAPRRRFNPIPLLKMSRSA